MEGREPNRLVLITGLDTIRRKNLHQLAGLAPFGYRFLVITNDQTGTSQALAKECQNVEVRLASSPRAGWKFFRLTFEALRREPVALVELYPFSLGGFLLAALARLFRKPLLLIARGEGEWNYRRKRMPLLRRLWFRLTYLLASGVLYKEPYMRNLMNAWGIRCARLLHNAVELPAGIRQHSPSGCHFLFLNSIRPVRHPEIPLEAFLELCEERSLKRNSPFRMSVVGFLGEKADAAVAAKEARLHAMLAGRDVPVECHPWTHDPQRWLDQADVFLLPAEVVYGNYALLEAMGRSQPALVQNAPAAEKIVTDGKDGFILPPLKDAWKAKMALLMDDADLRARMGAAARRKIAEHFSIESYLCAYDDLYRHLLARQKRA